MDSQSSYLIGYRIERTQNSAARGILCTSKYDRITPTLNYLHWLPVKPRFKFKLLLLKQKKGVEWISSKLFLVYKNFDIVPLMCTAHCWSSSGHDVYWPCTVITSTTTVGDHSALRVSLSRLVMIGKLYYMEKFLIVERCGNRAAICACCVILFLSKVHLLC